MIKLKWNLSLTLCIVGCWLLVACSSPAALQTGGESIPLTATSTTVDLKETPTSQLNDEPANTPVGQISTTLTLTKADSGKIIQLELGQRFTLQLGDATRWGITISDPNIVGRVIGSPAVPGVQGVFETKNPGQATLTATSSGGEEFQVTIEIPSSEALSATQVQRTSQKYLLDKVQMVTPLVGWALGSAQGPTESKDDFLRTQGVFRTTDGGHIWQNVTPPSLNQEAGMNAYFADPRHAWIASAVMTGADGKPESIVVYSTEDGGQTWQSSKPIMSAIEEGGIGDASGSLTFVDDQNGWLLINLNSDAGSESVNIYRTTDGGQTWSLAANSDDLLDSLPRGCTKIGLAFRDIQTGWITGTCTWGQLFFYVTQNGGQTWELASLMTPSNYPADQFVQCHCSVLPPQFPNEQFGALPVSISKNGNKPAAFLYLTQDGGQRWIPYALPMSTLNLAPVFTDSQNGWFSDGKALYITMDGGQSWTWISKLPVTTVLGGINFVDAQTGFITDGNQLYASRDGGKTWVSWKPVLQN